MSKYFAAFVLSGALFAEGPYRPGDSIKPPVVLSRQEPSYTLEAQNARVAGKIVVEVLIDEAGKVSKAAVMSTHLTNRVTGAEATQDYGLNGKAVEAIRNWQFKPASKDGRPVGYVATIEVDFDLV